MAQKGSNVAKVVRLALEAKTGKKIVTVLNARAALKQLPAELSPQKMKDRNKK